MAVCTHKKETQHQCSLGTLRICSTYKEYVNGEGCVVMQERTRVEYSDGGEGWLTQGMANELWNWQCSGFIGDPPEWMSPCISE